MEKPSLILIHAVLALITILGFVSRADALPRDNWRDRTAPNYPYKYTSRAETLRHSSHLHARSHTNSDQIFGPPQWEVEEIKVVGVYPFDPADEFFVKTVNEQRESASRALGIPSTYVWGVVNSNFNETIRGLIEDGFELFILGSPTYESLTDGFAREYPDLAFLLLFSTATGVFQEGVPDNMKFALPAQLLGNYYILGYFCGLYTSKIGLLTNANVPIAVLDYIMFGAKQARTDPQLFSRRVFDGIGFVGQRNEQEVGSYQAIVASQALVDEGVEIIISLGESGPDFSRSIAGTYNLPTTGNLQDASIISGPDAFISIVEDFYPTLTTVMTIWSQGKWLETPSTLTLIDDTFTDVSPLYPSALLSKFLEFKEANKNGLVTTLCAPGIQEAAPNLNLTDGCISIADFFTALSDFVAVDGIVDLGVLEPPIQKESGMSEGARIAMYFLISLCLFVTVVVVCLIFIWRGTAILHYSSPLFGVIIGLGTILVCVACYVYVPPVDSEYCTATVWLANIGMALIVWCLFVKTARLWILQKKTSKLVSIQITNTQLLQALVVGMAVEVTLLCLFSFIEPLEDKQDWTAIFQFHMICTAEAINFAFLLVMIVYKMVIVFFTWLAAFRARKLGDVFDEVSSLSVASYNLLMFTCVFVPIWALVSDFEAQTIVTIIGLLILANVTFWVLYIPKFVDILKDTEAAQPFEDYSPQTKSQAMSQAMSRG